MEGVGEDSPTDRSRADTPVAQTCLKLIVDPIDGTRSLMYDKRSAWVLAAVAPQRGPVHAACPTSWPPP